MDVASQAITETELATLFGEVALTEAEQFLIDADYADWKLASVRRVMFVKMIEQGATKWLDCRRGVHIFTFLDGSVLHVSRKGVQL